MQEQPCWRRDGMSTSCMVDQISGYVKRFESLDAADKAWAKDVYAPQQSLPDFLFQVNIIEGEGFESVERTREAVAELLSKDELDSQEADEKMEQVRCLYRALSLWWDDEEEAAFPTLNNYKLWKSHELLMASTQPQIAGIFRGPSEMASTITCQGKVHYYTSPSSIKPKLSNLMCRSQADVERILKLDDTRKMVKQLLVAATDFYYKFECIHPFSDGNGRCGRLMLAYLLRRISFFPNVFLTAGEFVDRNLYLKCFQDAREVDDNEPLDLTALVAEGIYFGWRKFFDALQATRAGD